MSLEVKSPDERKPQGADADVDGAVAPRPVLEAGFETILPARSRTISLSNPGDDWEITAVSCTCGSATATAQLASYPQPVIAVPSFDPGARPGSSACGAGGGSGVSLAATPSLALGYHPIGELATYPAPVIPVPGGTVPTTPARPEEPSRTPATVSWDANGTVSIEDADALGGAVTCRWTVELVYGDLIVRTKTKPPGNEGQFRYVATPASSEHAASPRAMAGSPSGDMAKLWKGSWSLEMQDPDERFELTGSSCQEADATTSSTASGTTAVIGLDPGDKVTCTFEMKLLAPRPGKWNARNGKGLVSCGVPAFKLPAVTEAGSLKVKQRGDKLVTRGLAPGSDATWTLYRDPDDPRQYRGKVSLSFAGGRGTFTSELRLLDEKHMQGGYGGTIKVRGKSCAFSRPLKLTYAGG